MNYSISNQEQIKQTAEGKRGRVEGCMSYIPTYLPTLTYLLTCVRRNLEHGAATLLSLHPGAFTPSLLHRP